MKIILPMPEKIIKTSDSESGPARYCSKNPLVRKIYLDRLQIAVDLLRDDYGRLLEAGFGNGMLFPTYNKLAQETYGIDIHGKEKEIAALFKGDFRYGSIYEIPFPDNHFDCVISLSVIEHLEDMDKALSEIGRVAQPDGDIIIGFPTDNLLIKLWFYYKKSPALKEHINGPKRILEKIRKHLEVREVKKLKLLGITFYTAIKCVKK